MEKTVYILLQAEEDRLTAAQQVADEKQRQATSNKKKRAAAGAALPAQNGESDGTAINSGVLQVPRS